MKYYKNIHASCKGQYIATTEPNDDEQVFYKESKDADWQKIKLDQVRWVNLEEIKKQEIFLELL